MYRNAQAESWHIMHLDIESIACVIGGTNMIACFNESSEVHQGRHDHGNMHQLMTGADEVERVRSPSLRNLYRSQKSGRRKYSGVHNAFVT
jgi:hypothetical protein